MVGMLYAEFEYVSPPPAYNSLNNQFTTVDDTNHNATADDDAAAAAAGEDADADGGDGDGDGEDADGDGDGGDGEDADGGDGESSVIRSNPPSYRSHVSRGHVTSTDSVTSPPPVYDHVTVDVTSAS